jgi:hypothetical protein
MNLLTVIEIGSLAFALAFFAYGKIPGRDAGPDPLVRGAGVVLTLPAGVGLTAGFTLPRADMGIWATVLNAAIFVTSLLVCATLSVLLCVEASTEGQVLPERCGPRNNTAVHAPRSKDHECREALRSVHAVR